ncbi:flagellar hook-basal body complex protein FliE [Anaerocolumna sp. MB42-C2]|uniref:flagellar hook-basal body complex protein FliE n=1 Tax=Anaerocolumna sp. MB42-C2 TaxID=3070997 RepID=UPI0027E1EDA0|nr:flagellar hook-basal body complex protein FliE [Anaerocolumna sp. MB42-C2]WMJ88453.1 flagellar hook-basal body complex protein FliE [Anaerocolumna sp. MB42-C2]
MDIALLNGISDLSTFDRNTAAVNKTNKNETFENLFQSALSMVNNTNDLTNAAKNAEMSYALGFNENTHDLQVAQQKANLSLQYTVAVRNKVLESYKEIMNLQF